MLQNNHKNGTVTNPLSVQIERLYPQRSVSSENDTFIFIKMRVKHSPHYLWSSYSSTFRRKVANYLIVEKGQIVRLRMNQRKRRKLLPHRSALKKAVTAPCSPQIESSEHHQFGSAASMKAQSVSPRKSTTNEASVISVNSASSMSRGSKASKSPSIKDVVAEYLDYYTFDSIVIKEGGTLTIDQDEGRSDRAAMNGIYSKLSGASGDVESAENGNGLNGADGDDDEEEQMKPTGYLHLVIGDMVIERGGKIEVSGMGYAGGGRYESGDSVNFCGEMETQNNKGGGGGSKTYELGCGGGGGYGTNGDNGCSGKGFGFGNNKTKYREDIDGRGGRMYGDTQLSVCHFGSGGGGGDYGDSTGGNGGGIVIIDCRRNVTMHEGSVIRANGEQGKYGSDGCGSGGSVYIKCKSLQMRHTASIEAIGGRNRLKGNGGNGGDGRIRIKCESPNVPWAKCNITPRPYLG